MTAEFPSTIDAGELLKHRAFVRRLARELAGPGGADDLEQDAWVAALESPPRLTAAARGWFRVVLRNLAGRRARGEARREEREERAARPEPVTSDVVDRLALERRLVQAVEALREPYRSTVFLRYFEDLAPPAIAEREGVPLATVKTRLRRGLRLLRVTMEKETGGKAWMAPLARISVPTTVLTSKALIVTAGAAIVATTLVFLRASGTGRGLASTQPAVTLASKETPRSTPELGALAAPEALVEEARDSLPTPEVETLPADDPESESAPESAPADPEPADTLVLEGRVLFPDGGGVEGASVALGPWQTTTRANGAFALAIEREGLSGMPGLGGGRTETVRRDSALVASLAEWAPAIAEDVGQSLLAAVRSDRSPRPVELVLPGPSERLTGIILDSTGAPATGWRIALLDGTPVFSGRYRPFSAEEVASGVSSHTETPDGHFAFEGLAPNRDYRVRAWNRSSLEQMTSEPLAAGSREVVLQAPLDAWRPVVDGVVVGVDGTPLADVRCRLSMHEYTSDGGSWSTSRQHVQSDAFGRFEFLDVPPAELFLRFHGHAAGTSIPLAPDDPGRNLYVVLVRSGTFRFQAADPANPPDAIRFLDANEEELRIEVDVGPGTTRGTKELELTGGQGTGRVSEDARWIVLSKGGRETARRSVVIRAAEATDVRY